MEGSVAESTRSIPNIPMTTSTNLNPSTAFNDPNDDDLLCNIDIDCIAATVTAPTESIVDTTPFEDIDDNDFLQIDDPIAAQLPVNSEPNKVQPIQIDYTESERRRETHHQQPIHEMSICDENYPFKIRGLNLVTIKQLQACSNERKQRRNYFIIKAEVDAIVETAHVSRNKWSLGVLLTDDQSENLLQIRFSNEVLEKLAGVSAQEIHEMNTLRKSRPHVAGDIEKVRESEQSTISVLTNLCSRFM